MFNLIVNNGSASKKYSLYEKNNFLFSVHYESVAESYVKTEKDGESEKEFVIDSELFADAFGDFIVSIIKKRLIISEEDIEKIGLRVVAPGTFFQEHRLVDSDFLSSLDDKKELSPLHINPVQKEISEILEKIPHAKIYAISDSAFHNTKPDFASIYAYPKEITEELEIYRFGYHGLSVSSVINKLGDKRPDKIIVCHLGGGSSLTAVKNGVSVDNTMGFSPLEGVPMATRIGNADPNSLLAVMDYKDFDIKETQDFLYKKCGFKGISGLSGDTRVILDAAKKGNKDAELALNYYAYEIRKNIGSYWAVMGGLDMIIFTGTIGYRSADVRQRICEGLEPEGIILDKTKNKMMTNSEGLASRPESKVDIHIFMTDEMGEMNRILEDIS